MVYTPDSSYAGATFDAKKAAGFHDDWQRENQIAEIGVLSGTYAYSVDTGGKNYHRTLHAANLTAAGLLTLQLAQGITKRALVLHGVSIANVMLYRVTNVQVADLEDYVEADLELVREA